MKWFKVLKRDVITLEVSFGNAGPGSMTSKEEVYSVTEIEISYSRELVSKMERKSSQKDRKGKISLVYLMALIL